MKFCWAIMAVVSFSGCKQDDDTPLEKAVGVLADLATKDLDKRLEEVDRPKVECRVAVKPSKWKKKIKKAHRLDLTPFGFKVSMQVPKGALVESLPGLLKNSPPTVRVRRGVDDEENLIPESPRAFRLILKTARENVDHDRAAHVKDLHEMTKELGGKLTVVREHQGDNGWELVYHVVEEPGAPPNWTTAVWRSDLGLACGSFMHFGKKQIESVLEMCRSIEPL